MVSDDHGMLPSVSAKLIRRKVCEKNSVFCCVLAVEMLQDGKPTLIYAIVARNLKKILQKRTLWDITSAKMTLEETKRNFMGSHLFHDGRQRLFSGSGRRNAYA